MSTAARKCCVHVTSKKFLPNLLIGVSNTTNVNYAVKFRCLVLIYLRLYYFHIYFTWGKHFIKNLLPLNQNPLKHKVILSVSPNHSFGTGGLGLRLDNKRVVGFKSLFSMKAQSGQGYRVKLIKCSWFFYRALQKLLTRG